MKILAVDVGNSEIKRAVIEKGDVGQVERSSTRDSESILKELASSEFPLVLCSVRSHVSRNIRTALESNSKQVALELSAKIHEPVSGFYEGIGADRIADVAAAWEMFEGDRPVVAIDFGTATTITAASRAGKFKGGFITLGLGTICAKLSEALPELPIIDPRQAKSLEPAYDSYGAICRGTVTAHVGIVENWISIFKTELGDDLAVIATGGWSEYLAPLCKSIERTDPHLTLKGIWSLYKHANKTMPKPNSTQIK